MMTIHYGSRWSLIVICILTLILGAAHMLVGVTK